MKPTTLSDIARWSGGELLQGTPADTVSKVSTDTRSLSGGEIFVALKGERYDAHDHLSEAISKGAKALLVHDLRPATEDVDCAIIRVKNTLTGLQSWARNYRDALGLKVVGVTGSSGKTSTKDLIRAVLSQQFVTTATVGNLNNHFGVPLTILATEADAEVGVFEMGMSNPGEIELLAEIANPNVAVITNVGTAHIEFMKTREAIAQEKGMLAEAIDSDECVILPAADDFTESIRKRCRGQVLIAGLGLGDIQATDLVKSPEGTHFKLSYHGQSVEVDLKVPGEHMVSNATLAAATGIHLGLSLAQIAAGLSSASLTKGRMEKKVIAGLTFLDDSYNANPDSMRAALRTLQGLSVTGKRIAALGLMAELGELSESEHNALGEAVAENGIDRLLVIGEVGQQIAAGAGDRVETHVFEDHAGIADYLRANAGPEDLVLLKGSRSAKMETVLTHLTTTD